MTHKLFVEDLAAVLGVDPPTLTDDGRLALDSLGMVATIALIDEHYGVTVDVKSLAACKSVGELKRLIDQKIA